MGQAKAPTHPARPARRIIERPRLLKLLEETDAQTILLVAPAGYGKTTLARQWCQSRRAWTITASQGSSDVAQLAVQLADALESFRPGLVVRVEAVLRGLTNPSRQQESLISAFVAWLSPVGLAEAVGFIDDYQLIAETPSAEQFVQAVRARLGLRLLIASRVRPTWASARDEIYGDLVELGPNDLALTEEESVELLRNTDVAQRDAVISRSRGWPAVLALATVTGPKVAPQNLGSTTLFQFFAEELFRAADESLRTDLATLALIPDLGADLLIGALGPDHQLTIARAVAGGFIMDSPIGPELHPLVREYLLTKLDDDPDVVIRVRDAFSLSIANGRWDGAFELTRRFPKADLLNDLIEASFKPLLFSGRIATLEQMVQHAYSVSREYEVVVELIEAEIAIRDGDFALAGSLAARVARRMDDSDQLKSHVYWVAGQSAQLMFDYPHALESFRNALSYARVDDDAREALWGLVLSSLYSETRDASEVIAQYAERRHVSSLDLVRSVTAVISYKRYGSGFGGPEGVDEALFVLPRVADPRVRTSFLNTCAYNRILMADYAGASRITDISERDTDACGLNWVAAHVAWAKAASAMGVRKFAVANRHLQRVDHFASSLNDGHLTLNAAALRARLLLALQRPQDALTALAVDHSLAAHGSMRAEFFATQALVRAVLGDSDESRALVEQARRLTASLEVESLARWVRVILGEEEASECFEHASSKVVWDPMICAIRAHPALLRVLVEDTSSIATLTTVLGRSMDYDLARAYGIRLPRRPSADSMSTLSPREHEVMQLIRQGLTNNEIAKTLFISNATVKVHVRHILDKIGVRSRTEAATWSEIET